MPIVADFGPDIQEYSELSGGGADHWARVLCAQTEGSWGRVCDSDQALAVVTGLASGETGPEGVRWLLVLASLAVYTLALIATGVGGVLLLGDLFSKSYK
ncbi:MAG: hypothetical protein AB1894_19440 [Chloroflexota bacterium]